MQVRQLTTLAEGMKVLRPAGAAPHVDDAIDSNREKKNPGTQNKACQESAAFYRHTGEKCYYQTSPFFICRKVGAKKKKTIDQDDIDCGLTD